MRRDQLRRTRISFQPKQMLIERARRLAYARVTNARDARDLAREIGIVWPRQSLEVRRDRSGFLTVRPARRQPKRRDVADLLRTIKSVASCLDAIVSGDSNVKVPSLEFVRALAEMTTRADGRMPADVLANYALAVIAKEPYVRRCRFCDQVFVARKTRGKRPVYCSPQCVKGKAKLSRA